jgi:hypothetical protein
VLQQFNREVAGAAADGSDFAKCFEFDIQVPADLDQFR